MRRWRKGKKGNLIVREYYNAHILSLPRVEKWGPTYLNLCDRRQVKSLRITHLEGLLPYKNEHTFFILFQVLFYPLLKSHFQSSVPAKVLLICVCVCVRTRVCTHTHIYHSEGRTREIKRDTKKADNVFLFCFLINIYGNFSLGLFLTLSITVGLLGDKSVFPILVLGKQET